MSKETRKDVVLIVIFSLASAIGVTSVFGGYRLLAWIAIVISDLYLSTVLLLAAFRAEDDAFLNRHPWTARFFTRKPAGILIVTLLLLAIVFGFAGLYVGSDVFSSSKTPLDAIYVSLFILGFTDFSPKPGYGQVVVICQLASGVLLLFASFPLLISRISSFKSP
jgi:hypothetical protein